MEAGANPEKNLGQEPDADLGADGFYEYQKRQRKKIAAIAFLTVLAIFICVFMVMQMRDILAIPFPGGIKLSDLEERAKQAAKMEVVKPIEEEDVSVLKQRDTDEDGLTDFEELYIYKTSPYLADTDSDGATDIDEIKNQEDPTCPQGQNCFRTSELYAEVQTQKEQELKLTAEQLRALLSATGKFTPDQIKMFSDAELLDFYEQMLKSDPELAKKMGVEGLSKTETTQTQKTPAEIMAEIDNTPPEKIREILRGQGIDEATLNQVDDKTLKELYRKAYDEANKKLQ